MALAKEIRAELERPEEDQLRELGLALGRGAVLGDPARRAKDMLGGLNDQLRPLICDRPLVRLLYEEKADTVFLVAAIADSVSSLFLTLGISISLATFAVLVFRAGVGELCRPVWR